ncbi:hypothetical protein DFH09DRAFT_1299546 [Mycena vulgaris]|nr:hypothetical protein DFH09DRAFT_1299546 [Mycena vulgaris]
MARHRAGGPPGRLTDAHHKALPRRRASMRALAGVAPPVHPSSAFCNASRPHATPAMQIVIGDRLSNAPRFAAAGTPLKAGSDKTRCCPVYPAPCAADYRRSGSTPRA